MSIVFWFLAPMFGLAAIVVSRIVAGLNPLLPASYVGTLSHFHFIAFSISMLSIAELIELAGNMNKKDIRGPEGRKIAVEGLLALLLSFLIFGLYFTALQTDISQEPTFSGWDGLVVLVFLCATSVLGFVIRVQLESVRRGR